LRWSGYEYENHHFSIQNKFFDFKNIDDLIENVQGKAGGAFGLCLADAQGNIGFLPHGLFPKRNDIYAAASGIKPGWTGDYEWEGYIEKSKVPVLKNPKKGYIFTANGRISSLNVEAGIAVTTASTARAKRIDSLLNDLIHTQKKKVGIQDMKRILNDTYDIFAAEKAPIMIDIVEKNNNLEKYINDPKKVEQIRTWLSELKSWNYHFDQNMTQPTIYTLWDIYFVNNLFNKQIKNENLRNLASVNFGFDDFTLDLLKNIQKDPSYFSKYCQSGNKDVPNACVKALVDGLDFVHEYLIPAGTSLAVDDALYGKWHTVEYRYAPFTRSLFRYFFDRRDSDSGSKNTINVGSVYYSQFKEKGLESSHTPNYRMIVDFGNDANNQFSIETGCSENILGKYFYYNLHDKHMSLEMVPMNFNSLNTSHTHRYSTIRFIYKDWYDQEEERLRKLEEAKQKAQNEGKEKQEDL
jgi:acyl-homoserine lactone acylase PvdQ